MRRMIALEAAWQQVYEFADVAAADLFQCREIQLSDSVFGDKTPQQVLDDLRVRKQELVARVMAGIGGHAPMLPLRSGGFQARKRLRAGWLSRAPGVPVNCRQAGDPGGHLLICKSVQGLPDSAHCSSMELA